MKIAKFFDTQTDIDAQAKLDASALKTMRHILRPRFIAVVLTAPTSLCSAVTPESRNISNGTATARDAMAQKSKERGWTLDLEISTKAIDASSTDLSGNEFGNRKIQGNSRGSTVLILLLG